MATATTTSTTPTATATNLGTSTTLAPWSNNYVTSMLGQASALAQQPYQWYQGAMTAGASPLQEQAFQGIGGLQTPASMGQAQQGMQNAMTGLGGLSYDPSQITTGQWSQQAAQQYMNPYLMEALNPQLDEARRQADISRMADAARLTKAGAYGGSRQAIMESEGRRNLEGRLADITGKGYFDAYNTGMQGFMTDQDRALRAQTATEQSKQFGASYGMDALQAQANAAQGLAGLASTEQGMNLANLQAQMQAGATQRDIDQQGLDAEYQLWAQAQQHPYQSLEFQKSMLSGIPTVIEQGNKLDDIGKLTAILSGAQTLQGSGLYDYLTGLLGGSST